MTELEREQSIVWGFWLIFLNVGCLYLGSVPLLLWMAPPNPLVYLLAPVVLAMVMGGCFGVFVAFMVLAVIFILSLWLGRTRYWWAIPIGLFAASLAHALLAIEGLRAYIT